MHERPVLIGWCPIHGFRADHGSGMCSAEVDEDWTTIGCRELLQRVVTEPIPDHQEGRKG